MYTRPNLKARLSRAKRSNISVPSVSDTFRRFKWFTLALIVIFPTYPSLSFLGGGASAHGDYDESTIITAYNDINDIDGSGYISETGLVRPGDEAEDQAKAPSPQVLDSGGVKNIIKTYTVQKGESIKSISDTF